jgi:IS30 family transposase
MMTNEKTSKKNKHLTSDDRQEIQTCLDHGMTFKAIAQRVGKDQTTISKEVKKHLEVKDIGIVCKDRDGNIKAPEICPSLLKAPFVCNPCLKRHARCKYTKQFYHANNAQKEYEELLSEAREGIPLDKVAFYEIDKVISNGVNNGQHLYHIMKTHDLGVSKSTVYRHLKLGYLSVFPADFPRVVKFKARKPKYAVYVPKATKIGRTYDDFLSHISESGISSWVEMDTVIGRIGGKVIVTFDFTFCNFMVGLLISDKTALHVSEAISELKSKFDSEGLKFGDTFPTILTDNGGEFANVSAIESNDDGEKETQLFFCDPYKSCQKPRVEKNHTLFRDIVPKGKSFDEFSQNTVNMIFSHVNSIKRKSLGGKTPYEVFVFTFGETITKILGIEPVHAKDVVQSPKLIKLLKK